jgi:acyl-CoA synthetase (AMP-forming)/AMP-acid ligase II
VSAEHLLPDSIQTIPEAIAWWAEQTPDAPAILPASATAPTITYRALQRRVAALAAHLYSAGVAPGEAVAFQPAGGAEAAVAFLVTMHLGIAQPLAPNASEPELFSVLRALAPKAVLTDDRQSPLARAAHQARVLALHAPHQYVECPAPDAADDVTSLGHSPAADDIALILHTSGATGRPRGIARTHGNLLASASAFGAWMGRAAFARVLVTTPLSFGMGANAFLTTLCAGGGVALVARGDPESIVQAIQRSRPTWTYIVPALLEEVLQMSAASGRPPASDWLAIGIAGKSHARTLAERVEAMVGAPLVEGYGCGEAGLIAGTRPERDAAPGFHGHVFAGDIAILDENRAPCPPGVPGEIVVRGPQVSTRYLADAMATAAAFLPAGWFRTGDLGYLDDNGCLCLTGRLKEIINRGGEKLAPEEIDDALLDHPAVAEAAAFAIPDERLGEEVAIAVVLEPGVSVSRRELRRAVATRLSLSKVPRRIWFVASLPRTATGKVRRGELSRLWCEVHP